MKRIVSLVLALSMVLSMFTFAFAGSTLPDVEGTDYEAAVSALVELGIVNGYEDGTYKADRTVTRAEMAKFLVVSAGLEDAADVAKGATKFSDVAANHWATGYINVAAEYGYINGYPEGTFAPDAIVSYAEAVTMAIRVLGYKTVVEAKGTWPTNYIAKATELKVLEDVEYGKYTDGATRGNVALLMWNMLTTRMWDVESENESTGLNYKKQGTMIEKYFEEYDYIDEEEELFVTDIDVLDGEVTVDLSVPSGDNDSRVVMNDEKLSAGTDFLKLYGRKVSVLYNTDTEEIVMITPSNEDKVVEGYEYDLVKAKYTWTGEHEFGWGSFNQEVDVYVSSLVDSKKVLDYATYFGTADTVRVEKVADAKNDAVRVTPVTGTSFEIKEEAIVLMDGEWATGKDIEAGDVVTTLVTGELYAVSREVVEGSFDEVTIEVDKDGIENFVKIDGEKYNLLATIAEGVVEVDEDGEIVDGETFTNIMENDESKYYGVDCRAYLNFLGEVVAVEFDEFDAVEETSNFYVLTNTKPTWDVDDKTGTTTYIELSEESYEIKAAKVEEIKALDLESGDVVLVTFDSKDRVKKVIPVVDGGSGDDHDFIEVDGNGESILDGNYLVDGSARYKVTSSTVVYTITPVKDEEEKDLYVGYEVEVSKGSDALKGIDYAMIAVEKEDSFKDVAYAFVWDDAKNTDIQYGIVEKVGLTNGVMYVTIDGTRYELDEESDIPETGSVVAFTVTDDVMMVEKEFGLNEILSGDVVTEVKKGDRRNAILNNDADHPLDLDEELVEKYYENYLIAIIEVAYSVEDEAYEFTNIEEVSYDEVTFNKYDFLAETDEDDSFDAVVIIRGVEEEHVEALLGA